MIRIYKVVYLGMFGTVYTEKVFHTKEVAGRYIVDQVFDSHKFDRALRKEGLDITKENLYIYFNQCLDWNLDIIGYSIW